MEILVMSNSLYNREPIRHVGGIPVFAGENSYISNYEAIASDHLEAEKITGENPFMNPALWEEIEASTVSLIHKHAPDGGKTLDVGVGTGRLLDRLGPKYEKHGVDISTTYLDLAASKKIEACLAMVEDLPYSDQTFDIVVTTDVLEHVLDLNTAVREMLRVLKPNGKLFIRVPYRESLKAYLGSKYEFTHLRNFDEYSLSLLLEKIMGCKVLEYATSGGLITREHLKSAFPNIFKIIFFLFGHSLKFIHTGLWRAFADKFYPHSEITIVATKKPE